MQSIHYWIRIAIALFTLLKKTTIIDITLLALISLMAIFVFVLPTFKKIVNETLNN